jgi:hypothetical protein
MIFSLNRQKTSLWLRFMAGPVLPFILLPLFMALLIAGTLAQRTIGLYDAQKLFFSSFILWAGWLPLPGGALLAGILTLALAIKFIGFSVWRWDRAGINLAHLGILILLGGGFLSTFQTEEGAMVLAREQSTRTVQDYHAREFVVLDGDSIAKVFPASQIKPRARLRLPEKNVTIDIISQCRNCSIRRRPKDADNTGRRSMARAVDLVSKKPEIEDENNLSGLTVKISGVSEEADGIYVFFDAMQAPFHVGSMEMLYARAQRKLPFAIRLKEFRRETHPGTDKARHYSSHVIVEDGNTSWPAVIDMNAPLRYRGYTLFQSSFVEEGGVRRNVASVLAIVKNRAWVFPYIGTAILSAGLLLHLGMMLRKGRKKAS